MTIKIKRKFFQIYIETEPLPFDGAKLTLNTLRAAILQCLASSRFREVIFQPRYTGYEQNIVRVEDPEAEVKWGTNCNGFYLQVSVSDKAQLVKLTEKVIDALKTWVKREGLKDG